MEKAIINTLDYFGPLKAWEIQKWLIKYKASLKQVEKALNRLVKKGKIKEERGVFKIKGSRVKNLAKANYNKRQILKLLTKIVNLKLLAIYRNSIILVTDTGFLKNILKYYSNILILSPNSLALYNKKIMVAEMLLKMQILSQKGKTYQKLLESNEWVFKFFPNWITNQK